MDAHDQAGEFGPDRNSLEQAKSLAKGIIERYVKRFSSNMVRANAILKLVPYPTVPPSALTGAQEDLLRATVVFLHAALEDLLRTLAEARLPLGRADALGKIPLVGTDRAEKFSLVQLAGYRGKTVEEVIAASVSEHLGRTSFNNVTDIAALLEKFGVTVDSVEQFFPPLEEMIKRRHRIVHQADLELGTVGPTSITREQVSTWLIATAEFGIRVVAEFGVTVTMGTVSMRLSVPKAERARTNGGQKETPAS